MLKEKCFYGILRQQSHQLWHVCVLAAIVGWYDGVVRARALLRDEGCAAYVSAG